jgi:hypothetical protein
VSDTPDGAYERAETVFPVFTHEPTAARAPTGEFVLFVTHHDGPPTAAGEADTCNCTDGSSESGGCSNELGPCDPAKHAEGQCSANTYMSFASSPHGPWSALQVLPFSQSWSIDTNFAPVSAAAAAAAAAVLAASPPPAPGPLALHSLG